MVLDRQEICRLRQSLRDPAGGSPATQYLAPNAPVPKFKPPTNLFKRVVNQQVNRVQGPLAPDATEDDRLAQQLNQLKAYYEDKIAQQSKMAADVAAQLEVVQAEKSCFEQQTADMQALVETQYEKLRQASDEYASILSWCRERERFWKRTEDDLTAATRHIEELVVNIKALEEARGAFETEYEHQRRAWAAHKDELDHRIEQLLFQDEMLRKDQAALSSKLQAEATARGQAEATVEKLLAQNRDLCAELDQLKQEKIALHGQLEMEANLRNSVAMENRALSFDLQRDRQEAHAKHVQDLDAITVLEHQVREKDMACWTLKQQLQRLANDAHVVQTRCDKAEASVEHLTTAAEGFKDTVRSLTSEIQRLLGILRDERSVLEAKEMTLVKLRRELSETQDRLVEEEERKMEAQKEASTLSQR
ncbi:hypothetical protein ACHHYP_10862 [Achlya hypogyna]|uniref:Uncharacterized protein n=1 Tax=Achlya hypogyna TaxID=1202772 RepID=A0A1V9YKC9_ACHHY|nr:hypothetical protein ACHHYP_10862 [Achlya hypogyna]